MTEQRHRTRRVGERTEQWFHRATGIAMQRWPRAVPPPHLLRSCRIISHRGEHDNRRRIENTLPAFDAAVDAGIWGIEMDIRWTRDLLPVVVHDADARRLFARDTRISRTPLARIKQEFPLIPTLAEVIDRYGGRIHLMLEIKREPYPRPMEQSRMMQRMLRHLVPGEDFHLMGLHPCMFDSFGFLPSKTFVPIARARIDRFSRLAALRRWGGLAGHYLLATRRLINRHHRMEQGIGTGFVDSPGCLFREVSRGVDWIFSNKAAALQAEVGRLRSDV